MVGTSSSTCVAEDCATSKSATPDIQFVEYRAAVCVLDGIQIRWSVRTIQLNENGGNLLWAGIYRKEADSAEILLGRIDLYDGTNSLPESLQALHSVIQGGLEWPSTPPAIIKLEWNATPNPTIVLTFDFETNSPPLHDAIALNNALVFEDGEVNLVQGNGTWSADTRSLTISDIDEASYSAITASAASGNLSARVRQKVLPPGVHFLSSPSSTTSISSVKNADSIKSIKESENIDNDSSIITGEAVLRVTSAGQYTARLHLGESMIAEVNNPISVRQCGGELLLSGSNSAKGNKLEEVVLPPVPFYSIDGVIALPGNKVVQIPASIFPSPTLHGIDSDVISVSEDKGSADYSWSIGFWINLPGDENMREEKLRCLFRKGDISGDNRTPAIFVLPHTGRLHVDVWTNIGRDGGETDVVITPGVWNHLVFTFERATPGVGYQCTIYKDGVLKTTLTFHKTVRVLSNNNPFFIDGAGQGRRSFFTQLRLWPGVLSAKAVSSEYSRTAAIFKQSADSTSGVGDYKTDTGHLVRGDVVGTLPSRSKAARAVASTLRHVSNADWLARIDDEAFSAQAAQSAEETERLCHPVPERVEAYRLAAAGGHAQSQYKYANLLLAGREDWYSLADESCWSRGTEERSPGTVFPHLVEAVTHLRSAASKGNGQAAHTLAILTLNGLLPQPSTSMNAEDTHKIHHADGSTCKNCEKNRSGGTYSGTGSVLLPTGVGDAVPPVWSRAPGNAQYAYKEYMKASEVSTEQAIGLLHSAAACDDGEEAALALGIRYMYGRGVEEDVEAAAWYLVSASDKASVSQHTPGKQRLHHMVRLTQYNEGTVAAGERGEEDEMISFQAIQASQGHVQSMVAMGDLHYWGARGVERNHARALDYFNQAAGHGHNDGRVGAAGMYLKGEGAPANHTRAVELYEAAAKEGHVRALNGLGYEHYFGGHLPQNITKAREYFLQAAALDSDGDSIFNAAHLLERGEGGDKDVPRAREMYRRAAEGFGHFDSAHRLGLMLWQGGVGIERNVKEAAKYLLWAAKAGPWGSLLRVGFDCHLTEAHGCSFLAYARASELDYNVAPGNAAYALDARTPNLGTAPLLASVDTHGSVDNVGSSIGNSVELLDDHHMDVSLRFHLMSAATGYVLSYTAIGDGYYRGKGAYIQDYGKALWWYSRASASGSARGTYAVGYMHENGLGTPKNLQRAMQIYRKVGAMATEEPPEAAQGEGRGLSLKILVWVTQARVSGKMLIAPLLPAHEPSAKVPSAVSLDGEAFVQKHMSSDLMIFVGLFVALFIVQAYRRHRKRRRQIH